MLHHLTMFYTSFTWRRIRAWVNMFPMLEKKQDNSHWPDPSLPVALSALRSQSRKTLLELCSILLKFTDISVKPHPACYIWFRLWSSSLICNYCSQSSERSVGCKRTGSRDYEAYQASWWALGYSVRWSHHCWWWIRRYWLDSSVVEIGQSRRRH